MESLKSVRQARTKQPAWQGVGWSDVKKEEGKKRGRKEDGPVGLDEPSGLTVGPYLIGRPVSAWMTTKQD